MRTAHVLIGLALLGTTACAKPIDPPPLLFERDMTMRLDPTVSTVHVDLVVTAAEPVGRHVDGLARAEQHAYTIRDRDLVLRARLTEAARRFGLGPVAAEAPALLRLSARVTTFTVETSGFFAGDNASARVEGELALQLDDGTPVFAQPVTAWQESAGAGPTLLFDVFDRAVIDYFELLAHRLETNPLILQRVTGADRESGGLDLAVLPARFADADRDAVPEIIDEYLIKVVREAGIPEALGDDAIAAKLGFERRRRMLACDTPSCLAELGGALAVERLLVVEIARAGTAWVVALRIFEVERATATTDLSETIEGDGRALLEGLAALVQTTLAAAPPE